MQFLFKYFLATLLMMMISCSVSSIPLHVVRPADIDIPNNIQSVLIINRSSAAKGNQVENILDGLLSGESFGEDKKASEKCVEALKHTLMLQPDDISRFDILDADTFLTSNEFRGTGTSDFPKPIRWKKINKLSKNYDFDGLIVLETFDSKSSFINGGVVEKVKRIKGKKIKQQLIEAFLDIEIQAGWRIYDVLNQKIIDEKIFLDRKSFSATGITFEEAKNKLPNKRFAISETGAFAGNQYAFRISPKKDKIYRSYYIKAKRKEKNANEKFKLASDLFKNNKIESAVSIWMEFVAHSDKKVASRACFNIALASELKNNYKLAINWIEKSIAYDDNKKSIKYFNQLKYRNQEFKKVEQQLKN